MLKSTPFNAGEVFNVPNISKAKELDMDKLKQIPDLFIHMSLCFQVLMTVPLMTRLTSVPRTVVSTSAFSQRLLPKVDTGMVNLNRGTIFSSGRLPFGGTKASGSFKPAGLFSPYYCTVPVAVLEDRRPLQMRNLPV